jgi:regulator of sigma E protease
LDTIITILQFILSLSILIVLHEMGHFFPARWFKTRVEKFYLFFDAPPFNSLVKTKKGETEYGIGWLPLGGYVKIAGMVDESMDTEALKEPPKPWEFRSKPAWQRLIIMIGGVTVNFILGFFIFAMILWHYGKSYVPASELDRDGLAFDSLLIRQGFQNGDNLVRVGNKTFERFDPGMFVEEIVLNGVRHVTVRRAGQEQTLTLSNDINDQITGKGSKSMLMNVRVPFNIGRVTKDSPADNTGLQADDRVISFNDQPTPFYDEFVPLARKNAEKTVKLGILRGSDTLYKQITLTSEGKIGVEAKPLDAYFKIGHERYSLAQAIPGGYQWGMDFLSTQIRAFGKMFTGEAKVKDNLGSFISIGKLFGGSWEQFWVLTASLSLILAFMNLLPIPALDGGYVLFLLWEVITRRKVSDAFMEKAVTAGFFLLMGFMVYAFGLDIWRHFIK